ncbi:MAG: DNA adenine methylase [Polyangiaceae bacterium]|nr:DNA adenine methylase [Polyangiaceae bacterium]
MADRRDSALAEARRVLAAVAPEAVEKTIWGSPAGKKRLADRLAAMLPAHKTYVEPFAGSAAVLFAKEPSEVEVINDADLEIAEAFRLIKGLTPKDLARLRKLPWVGNPDTFKALCAAEPRDSVGRLHRFLYVTHFSYGKLRGKSFSPSGAGVEATTLKRIEQFGPRLKHVRIYGGDYEKVVRKYDGKDTVFFLDPPYPGYNVDVGESDFDEERFFELLKSLKGKFLITYGIRGKFPGLVKDSGFWVKRIRTPRTIASMRGVGGSSVLTQLLVANYEPVTKGLSEVADLDDWHDHDSGSSAGLQSPVSSLEKAQPFGTFGGSFHYAKRIVPLIPAHKTYVEPFAGAAAVLHAKEPSEREVLADLDDDVVFLHRSIKAMTPERVAELARRFEWTVSEESFRKARDMAPKDDLGRFYKLVFVRTHARDCRPDGTHPAQNHLGSTTNPEKYLKAAERLRGVTILRQDYLKTLRAYDAPDTFFFIDPPYPGEWFDRSKVIDLEQFIGALSKLRGKFIAVLNPTPENVAAFKRVGHVFRLKVREASGRGGAKQAMRLFVANYPVRKAEELELVAKCDHLPLDPSVDALVFAKTTQLVKGLDPNDERYVLGIVLEPEVVDAQGDIYSVDEIRAAAHRFMEEFGGLGLMHRLRVNGQVKVLESYLAPTDFALGELTVRKGTWLLAVRVLSDELWDRVKSGELTGFSIGGSARRVPEPVPPAADEAPEPESPPTTEAA